MSSLNARENVMLPMREAGVSRREARERADKLLEEVGLEHRVEHKPGDMSGGQQQRVAIARARSPMIRRSSSPTNPLRISTTSRSTASCGCCAALRVPAGS